MADFEVADCVHVPWREKEARPAVVLDVLVPDDRGCVRMFVALGTRVKPDPGVKHVKVTKDDAGYHELRLHDVTYFKKSFEASIYNVTDTQIVDLDEVCPYSLLDALFELYGLP